MHSPQIVTLLVVLGMLFQAGLAKATNLTLPTGGLVTVEFLFSDAAFSNTLSIVSPTASIAITGCQLESVSGLNGVHLGSEKQSQRGCRVVLDADPGSPGIQGFPANTTIEFLMCAQTDADAACEDVWSSNPNNNSDNFDHLRTTPIHQAEYPDRIFQIAWEDLPNGGDNDFNDFVGVVRVDVDTDGDGLWDDWEQFGIDTNGDGTIDLNLPALGANRLQKDIFIEIDFMDCAVAGGDCAVGDVHTHRPLNDALNAVIQAFANAPVTNPSGTNGISLHIDVSNALPHQRVLNFTGTGGGDFDTVKADPANFGPANPRRFAYHYALFTHNENTVNNTSGRGELPGNDFYVSLGGWTNNVGTVQQQAGTLMHELGHNLNLQHGGGEGTNRKPNYISVMNYAFQTGGIPPTDPPGPLTRRIDYSATALAVLNENALTESTGIGNVADNTIYFCPNLTTRQVAGNGAIDWNCDGDTTDSGINANINGDCVDANSNGTCETGETRVLSSLQGYNDWANLKYDFQNGSEFVDGEHTTPDLQVELTDQIATQFQVLTVGLDIKPGGVPNSINILSQGVIPVAILSSPTFNAFTAVDVNSLTFGRIGTEPSLRSCSGAPVDVNGDGLGDLVCHFETTGAKFQIGDAQGILNGLTTAHISFMGSDSVRIISR